MKCQPLWLRLDHLCLASSAPAHTFLRSTSLSVPNELFCKSLVLFSPKGWGCCLCFALLPDFFVWIRNTKENGAFLIWRFLPWLVMPSVQSKTVRGDLELDLPGGCKATNSTEEGWPECGGNPAPLLATTLAHPHFCRFFLVLFRD